MRLEEVWEVVTLLVSGLQDLHRGPSRDLPRGSAFLVGILGKQRERYIDRKKISYIVLWIVIIYFSHLPYRTSANHSAQIR